MVGGAQPQEDEPTKHLALKVSGVHFWKRQRATGNGNSILFLVKQLNVCIYVWLCGVSIAAWALL